MGVNFVGNTWSTQFIFCSILRAHFAERPEALEALVAAYASDVASLATDGVTSSDGMTHVWCVHVGTKGDLPALAKLGVSRGPLAMFPKHLPQGLLAVAFVTCALQAAKLQMEMRSCHLKT